VRVGKVKTGKLYHLPQSLIFFLIFLVVFVGCRSHPPVDVFPVSNSSPGWVKSSATRTFEAGHLYEYIDGDADKYVQAGVVKTLTSDYRWKNRVDATVDVYVMGNAAGAHKIFDSASAVGSQPIAMGDAGRYAMGNLTFRQGPYFVRVVAFNDSPEIAPALIALSSALSGKLKSTPANK